MVDNIRGVAPPTHPIKSVCEDEGRREEIPFVGGTISYSINMMGVNASRIVRNCSIEHKGKQK